MKSNSMGHCREGSFPGAARVRLLKEAEGTVKKQKLLVGPGEGKDGFMDVCPIHLHRRPHFRGPILL